MLNLPFKAKKTRRGKRKCLNIVSNYTDKWSIYHTNIRNLDCRQTSLEAIISNNNYSIVTINETHFRSGRKVTLPNYFTYTRNRTDKASGGISTSIRCNESSECIRVEEGKEENEYILTRHSQFKRPINILNLYGQQECRMQRQETDKHWNEILELVAKVESRDESLVIIGDINKLVGNIIPGNNPKISYGGSLLRSFLDDGQYVLLNASNKVKGGPWTRVDPSDKESLSILDLAIVSVDLEKYVESFEIDSERRFTPFKRTKDNVVSFPDHFSIVVNFKGIPIKDSKTLNGKKSIQWNTNKPNGWKKYKELTDSNKKLDEIASSSMEDPNTIMKLIDSELNNIKYKVFGKVKVKKKTQKYEKLESMIAQRDRLVKISTNDEKVINLEKEICIELKERQRMKLNEEIEFLNKVKESKGKAAAIFKLKENILGKKKSTDEPSSIFDPMTNTHSFKPSDIVRISADYCEELLKNDDPKEGFEEDILFKRRIHSLRMKENVDNNVELTREMFDNSLKNLKAKKNKYNFVLNAGNSLHNAMFKLFKVVWNKVEKPDSWRDTTIVQIDKPKTKDKSDLNNKRNIHTKPQICKVFGNIVTAAIKPTITNNISKYQIGAIPGHRKEEHLFTLKSFAALAEHNDVPIAIKLLDLSKYYDKESLIDAMDELYKVDIKGKLYKLIFEMNKDTRIKVRTPVGESESRETGENIAQGTSEAGIISSVNLSEGVDDFFESSDNELFYGNVKLLPQMYVDDLMRICLDPESAQAGLDRFENLANHKLLQFNSLKSCLVVLGKKRAREKLEEKFMEVPPKLYGKALSIEPQATYLGDEIGGNVSESVSLTVNKRIGLAKKSIFEIKTIIEDCRSNVAGGIVSGILLWESCVLPFLLNNCSSWIGIRQGDFDKLIGIQNLFLNVLLGVQNCPSVLMMWDLCILSIPNRIMKEKLILYHHISCLPENALSRLVLENQKRFGFPGLHQEVVGFLNKHEISNIRSFSKHQWKKFIKKEMSSINRDFIIERSKHYKKLDYLSLSCEEYERKPYLNKLSLAQARLKFAERAKTMKFCRTHYPSDKANIKASFQCYNGCPNIDNLLHWRTCSFY